MVENQKWSLNHKNSSRYLNVLEISYPEILINEPKISYPEILINEPRISYPEILINEPKISYPEISLNPKYPIPRCNWTHISFLLILLNPRYPYLKILMNLRYSTHRSYWTRDTLPRDNIEPYKSFPLRDFNEPEIAVLRIRIRMIRKILASWIRIHKNMRIHGVKYQPKTAKKKTFYS